jgi:hypothetical protein
MSDDIFNIQKVEVQEDRWPWTNEWLKDKRAGLSNEQCKEIDIKANDKFAEISRISNGLGEEYTPDSQRKWQLDVDHRFLNKIVEEVVGRHDLNSAAAVDSSNKSTAVFVAGSTNQSDVMKSADQDSAAKKESSRSSNVAAGAVVVSQSNKDKSDQSQSSSDSDSDEKESKKSKKSQGKVDQEKESSRGSNVAAGAVVSQSSQSTEEDEEEEKKKKRKAEQESSTSDQAAASSTDSSSKDNSDGSKGGKSGSGYQSSGAKDRNVVIVPAVLESTPEEEYVYMNSAPSKISKGQTDNLLAQFKNYGMPIGLPGGTRSKDKNMAKNAIFAFEEADSIIVNENKGALEITFNGNCEREKYVEIKHNCFVRVDYDNQTGVVNVVKDKVFHKVDDEYREIDLKKTGGLFGKSDLEKELGNKQDYKDVKKSLKDLKIIACSNPTPVEGLVYEDQPRAQVAAMADGKTHGSRLSNVQKVGLAVALAAVGTVAILSGVGVVPGIGALMGAGGLITSGVSAAATATASGTTLAANTIASGVVTAANAVGNGLTSSAVKHAAHVVSDGVVMASNKTADGVVMVANKTADGTVMAANTVASHTPQVFKNAANVVADGSVMAANKTADGTVMAANKAASGVVSASKSAYAIPVAAGMAGVALGASAASVYKDSKNSNER